MGQYEYETCYGHPRANKDGSVYTHVLVAEQKLGRYLKPEEVVHHIDENKMNNNPDNLMVFATKADHTSFHNGRATLTDLVQNENGAYYVPLNKRSGFCRLCQAKIDSHATYCKSCWNTLQRKTRRMGRSELKNKIRNESFVEIGKQYGVSDNAIRKWCKSYGLPYRSKDIKIISDQDWVLL